jgi:hypothetical protein
VETTLLESTKRKDRVSARVDELLAERSGRLPIWIRSPHGGGIEFYSGVTRSKMYQLASDGLIESRSIREAGQTRGTRLFNLRSILDYIESCPTVHGGFVPRRKNRKETKGQSYIDETELRFRAQTARGKKAAE